MALSQMRSARTRTGGGASLPPCERSLVVDLHLEGENQLPSHQETENGTFVHIFLPSPVRTGEGQGVRATREPARTGSRGTGW